MKTQEIPIKSGTIRIILKPDAEVLEEVVVTGMQKMDKRLFTGAATKISAENAKMDGLADVSRALEGRAAGVSVQNVSGTFGTAPKIRVRGATSIYGSSKPLWVVDGVIMEDVTEVSADDLSSGDAVTLISSAISGLNADDIESFQNICIHGFYLLHKESKDNAACHCGGHLSGYVGADGVHQKMVGAVLSDTHFLNDTGGHGECGDPGSADHGVDLVLGEQV